LTTRDDLCKMGPNTILRMIRRYCLAAALTRPLLQSYDALGMHHPHPDDAPDADRAAVLRNLTHAARLCMSVSMDTIFAIRLYVGNCSVKPTVQAVLDELSTFLYSAVGETEGLLSTLKRLLPYFEPATHLDNQYLYSRRADLVAMGDAIRERVVEIWRTAQALYVLALALVAVM
jgi:hypothetical protein